MHLSHYPQISLFNKITENYTFFASSWHEFKNSVAVQIKVWHWQIFTKAISASSLLWNQCCSSGLNKCQPDGKYQGYGMACVKM
jgi:hypothetical protein